jgi:hypothetical protein
MTRAESVLAGNWQEPNDSGGHALVLGECLNGEDWPENARSDHFVPLSIDVGAA